MSALADWLDVRGAIVHEWSRNGATVEEIVRRLTPDEHKVRAWLGVPPLPLPGSSRALVVELRQRVDALERALLQLEPEAEPPRAAPRESEFRELTPKKAET